MTGKIHVTIGVGTLALISIKTFGNGFDFFGTTVYPVVGMLTAAAGSYAPDIDMQRTHAGQKHKVASKVISKVGGGHRGIMHTLLMPACLVTLMYIVGEYIDGILANGLMSLIFGFAYGYIMHLFADMFNGKGIPLFWPLMRGKVHIMDIDSSGWQAWTFCIVFLAIAGFIIFSSNI